MGSVRYTTRVPDIIHQCDNRTDRAIRKVAFDILAASQRVVPVAKSTPTHTGGNLKNSGNVETRPGHATIGYHANYAVYVHEGTMRMAARPFLREPFDQIAPNLARALRVVVEP